MQKQVYKELIVAIIDYTKKFIGPVAMTQAARIKGITILGKGEKIEIEGEDYQRIINDLIALYTSLFGPSALTLARNGARQVLEKNPGLKVPSGLREFSSEIRFKKIKTALVSAVIFVLTCVSIYVFMPSDSPLFTLVTDILFIIIGLGVSITVFYASKSFGFSSKEGKVWLYLSIGFFLWCLGDFFWAYNELVLKTNPFPSIADISYIVSYVFFIAGFLYELRIIKESITKKEVIKSSILVLFAALASIYFVLIPIAYSSEYDILSKIISLFYPIIDFVMLFFLFLLFFTFKDVFNYAKISRSWLILSVSFILILVADSLFAYFEWGYSYTGIYLVLCDLVWLIGYIMFAFGAFYHSHIFKGEA